MIWFGLAIAAVAAAYLVARYRALSLCVPRQPAWWYTWVPRGLWIGLCMLALAGLLKGLGEVLTAYAADGGERAYTTANPATADWLGLATQGGRYTILLGDGCDGIGPDMNVIADTSAEPWTLQLEGSDQVCTVAEWHWQGNTPCFTNEAGDCDVEDA